jgi:DnaJ-class molecular chaperone
VGMLFKQEQYSYNVAYSAAMGMPIDKWTVACPVCKGCGLLPHPTALWHIATCYMCNSAGVISKTQLEKIQARREHCNVSSTSLSA